MADSTSQGTILVVDDTEANRYTIARILGKEGFEVRQAVDGRAGLAAATPDLDLVILDIRMPEMDGYEAAKRLKADPLTRPIPILHISATYTENKDIAHGLEGGADGYLTHPVDPGVLIATVRAFMRIRRTDRALRDSEAHARARAEELQAVMAGVPAAVIIAHDPGCTTMTGNPAAREIFRLPPAAPLTRWPSHVTVRRAGADVSLPELPIQTAAREGIPVPSMDLEFVFDDGARAFVYGSATPLFDEAGRVRGAVGAFVDVTDRVQAQAQLERVQRMESLGRLAGGIAHETNNQMAVVLGFTEFVLRESNLTPDQRLDLAQVKGGAERVAHLTRQLLTLSRQQTQHLEALDLDVVVLDTHALIARLLGPDVPVRISSDGSPKWVRADRTQLVQVLLNLAINGRDAMPEGGELRISLSRPAENLTGGHLGRVWGHDTLTVTLSVSDSGTGIDPAVSAHIFEPFFTTKPTGQGTGLGLSVVEGIVEQSGGDIRIESRVGHGTTVTIALPLVDRPPVRAEVPLPITPGGKETLLVVDDEEALRRMFVRELGERGYRTLEAANGREAMEMLDRMGAEVDLIVSDVAMPQMNGLDLARLASAAYPRIRFVFVSGQPRESLSGIGQLTEQGTLLEKPFTAERLAAAVRKALDRSAAGRRTT